MSHTHRGPKTTACNPTTTDRPATQDKKFSQNCSRARCPQMALLSVSSRTLRRRTLRRRTLRRRNLRRRTDPSSVNGVCLASSPLGAKNSTNKIKFVEFWLASFQQILAWPRTASLPKPTRADGASCSQPPKLVECDGFLRRPQAAGSRLRRWLRRDLRTVRDVVNVHLRMRLPS